MSSFNADKKREHEALAEKALAAGDYAKAFFHTAQAAEFTFNLADQSDGDVARAYLEDANELVDIAATFREQAGKSGVRVNKEETGNPASDVSVKGKWEAAADTNVRLADVIGLEDAKEIVADALINPVKHPDIYKTLKVRPGTGLMLFGPPRTGKTMFGRAIAGELDCAFIYVKCDELVSKYVGETEKNIAEVFKAARSHKRCVLFFDDCEKVMRKRGNQKVNSTGQFLTELDGFDKHEGSQVFVILATNRPWTVDGAILDSGRISAKAYVGLPNQAARERLITKALEGVPLSEDVSVEKLVTMTEGYAAGQISHRENGGGVCDVARTLASRRWVERRNSVQEGSEEWSKVEPVTWGDFESALKQVSPASRKHADYIKKNLTFRDTDGAFREEEGDDQD